MNALDLFINEPLAVEKNYYVLKSSAGEVNQQQTNEIFSDKWSQVNNKEDIGKLETFQKEWFLKLYGFDSESHLSAFLSDKKLILDAGCGLGYKAAWFANLAPQALVLGIDYSDAAHLAARNYSHLSNLVFMKGDIANTGIKDGLFDFVVCDQVIMHTEDPERTFRHLAQILAKGGEFACYVYAKKALPRELVDDYFRKQTHNIPSEQMWEMSRQLTILGEALSGLNVKFVAPDIPLLGIKGGEYDIQRFIYWNFLKCFWRDDWSRELCDATNFDWYSPSNARRYSQQEFLAMGSSTNLSVVFSHSEEACHTARFLK